LADLATSGQSGLQPDRTTKLSFRLHRTRAVGKTRTVLSQLYSPDKNAIALQIGLLDSRAAIRVRLLVLNSNSYLERVLDPVSTLKGLPKPIITSEGPARRISVKLLPWLWTGVVIIVVLVSLIEYFRERQKDPQWGSIGQLIYFAWHVIGLSIAWSILAAFAALGFGFLIAGVVSLYDLFLTLWS